MTTVPHGPIGEQHQAYRKGLVLGLTMAEVAILIIFVLLLLLVFNQLQRAALIDQLGGRDPSSLLVRAQAFDRIAAAMGPIPPDTSRNFDRLISAAVEAVKRPSASRAISAANGALQSISRATKQIESVASAAHHGGIDSLLRVVDEQAFAIGNTQGQIDALRAKLDSAGARGGALPSCWARQGGKIDYVYDVVLTSSGMRMRQYEYGERLKERMGITIWVPNPNDTLSEAAFTEYTRPWFDYSKRWDCRFFVVVYDETGPNEKARYKALLKTVENHFYKRLDNGRGPF